MIVVPDFYLLKFLTYMYLYIFKIITVSCALRDSVKYAAIRVNL